MSEMVEEEMELGNRKCPRGFDGYGFGDFVRHRDNRPVEAYFWGDGTISWITTDKETPVRSSICKVRSFLSHHSRALR
jgi:hypothetical protein